MSAVQTGSVLKNECAARVLSDTISDKNLGPRVQKPTCARTVGEKYWKCVPSSSFCTRGEKEEKKKGMALRDHPSNIMLSP